MKFSINSNDLLRGLLTVQKALPSKSSDPVLDNYMLSLEGSRLSITASNKEITLLTYLETNTTEIEGRICVPSRLVTDLLKELPNQPLTIDTASENSFHVNWVGGESILPYFTAEDYPETAVPGETAKTVTMDTQTLGDGIGSTIYAASNEENRPLMNAVYFDMKPDLSTFVASDLHKLICYNTTGIHTGEECNLVLNNRHAAVLRSVLPKENTECTVRFDEKIAVFEFGETTMFCALVSGKYPDYKTIIPKNNSNILRIGRTRLLNTVRRIAVCSPKASNHIKFELAPGSLEISAQDLGFEIAAHERIDCDYGGDTLSIGFKSTHLIEILSNLAGDSILMKFADKRRSVLILPEENEQADKVFGIVMPIMVK